VALPEDLDVIALRPAATAAGVAYVPGQPFYSGDEGEGANELRLSFSHLSEANLGVAVERLGGVVRSAMSA